MWLNLVAKFAGAWAVSIGVVLVIAVLAFTGMMAITIGLSLDAIIFLIRFLTT